MFRFLKIAKARKVAVATIAPLIGLSRDRCGTIPNMVWQQPYMIGFMTMLISLVAKAQSEEPLSSEQLGLLQLEAWSELTGEAESNLGQSIVKLSGDGDDAFVEGCRNAHRFLAAYYGHPHSHEPDPDDVNAFGLASSGPNDIEIFGAGGAAAAALWRECFERHLG